MKSFIHLAATATLFALSSLTALADDLADLQGIWSVRKASDEGQPYTQVVEIKKDRFTFKITGGDDRPVFFAEGSIRVEKLGPFSVAKFTGIKAGASESDTREVDDERASIYLLEGGAWTLASNFDRVRDKEKPKLDTYTKVGK